MNIIKHRPKAIELALVQAGYTLADIRGEREVHTVVEQPDGLLAAVGRVSPRSALLAAAGTITLGLFLAYETALLSPVAVSLALAYALHLLGEADPGASEVQHEVERPGMTHDEVQERLIQWHEWQRIEAEQQEKEARKAKRQSNTGSTGRRRH